MALIAQRGREIHQCGEIVAIRQGQRRLVAERRTAGGLVEDCAKGDHAVALVRRP